jgi:hypothetical protein
MVLSREDVEAVARRVVQLLQETSDGPSSRLAAVRLVDAATVAELFSVDRDWVYAHARELGAIRLGGERGRLRFDLDALQRQMRPDGVEPRHRGTPQPAHQSTRSTNGRIARRGVRG